MDILLVIIMCILLYRADIVKEHDYLSKENCNNIKGIFALVVVVHHLAQETNGGTWFGNFTKIGFLAVSVFFFISGYGLMRQYIIRKDKYLENFLARRVFGLFVQYIIISIIYFIFRKLIYNNVTIIDFFESFYNGKPIAYYSWFIIEILIFYIIFFVSCKIFRTNYNKNIFCIFLLILLFSLICYSADYGIWWYQSSIAFVLGLIGGAKKLNFLKYKGKKYILFFVSTTILFVTVFKINIKIQRCVNEKQLVALWGQITTFIFIIFLLLTAKHIRLENRVTQYLGKISYEMYITQGIPISLFRSRIINISNDVVYSILVILATIFLARVIKVLFGYIATLSKRSYT